MIRDVALRGKSFRVSEGDQAFLHRLSRAAIAFGATFSNDRFWSRYAQGRWESHTFRLFDRFLDSRHSYVDIGAWIGPTVLYAAQLAAHTYAIEPDPTAFSILKSNVRLNPLLAEKISLFNGALHPTSGTVELGACSSFGDSMSSVHFAGSSPTVTVDALSLEDLVDRYGISDCSLIKMDIEGGETGLLPSMKTFLKSQKPALMVSLHPFWFPDFTLDCEAILDTLSVYAHLYDKKGSEVTAQGLRKRLRSRLGLDLVATDPSL